MLSEIGVGLGEDIERAKRDSEGLRLFVRSLVGMDRGAAKEAFGGFLAGKMLRPAQIEFLDQGAMSPARPYKPPFTDLNGGGVDGMFSDGEVADLNPGPGAPVRSRVREEGLNRPSVSQIVGGADLIA